MADFSTLDQIWNGDPLQPEGEFQWLS